jgi:condensin complex subunit 2
MIQKITQKNSWQLNLIDYMEDVLEVSGDNPNFQTASCTLDASVKIYSCRVDSVHTDAYKVLGGLTRTGILLSRYCSFFFLIVCRARN